MTRHITTIFNIAALMFLLPTVSYADGGAPLLLIFNFVTFLYGSVAIILAEWLIYIFLASVPRGDAFWDAVVANLASTVLIGFGFPLAIGIVGYLGSSLPYGIGDIFLVVGTWVYENIKHPKLTKAMTLFWMAVTFLLTVLFEARILRKRWNERGFTGTISVNKLSWYSNGVTYIGIFIYFLVGWFTKL
jgi:hypothetical protein